MDDLFAGLNGYVWFVGVVENNADPLGTGRVQVRIIGHHNLDIDQVPTESLPWAVVAQPTNNPVIGGTGTYTTLPRGCRVIGFFMDGMTRQQPVVTSLLSGIQNFTKLNNIPAYASEYMPNINPLLGTSVEKETECVSGEYEKSNIVNDFRIDYRDLTFTPSNFVYPCTGYVRDVFMSRNGQHKGCDIGVINIQENYGATHLGGIYRGGTGEPVYSIADGTVFHIFKKSQGQRGVPTEYDKTGRGSRSFGNAVVIRHEVDGYVILSVYAHLGINQDAGDDTDNSGVLVSIGDTVTKGQQIGNIGRTHNRDTPTHLHFEIRFGENLGRGYNNLIPPQYIFPKMVAKDQSILDWVQSNIDYTVIPPMQQSDMPIQALEIPK